MTGWPLKRIVIAGGGTAGWMAAAAFAKTLGRFADIVLVESNAIGTIGVGESTIPPIRTFNNVLGIDEAEFMRTTQATFKLGIEFENWARDGDRYFHSFGITGKDHWSAGFQHFWLNGRERGHDRPYDDYCLELMSAYAGKFAHLPDNALNYAYQLDSTLYARFLRDMAERDGAVRQEGKIASVETDPQGRKIVSLMLESGQRIDGDLFLDCTGFRALLIGGALGAEFEDWTHWLPCDRAIAIQTESVGPPMPYTRAIAHDAGWRWRIPLQHRTGNGHVYSSAFMEDDEAERILLETLDTQPIADPKRLRFTAGRRTKAWEANVVAIGLSSGFLEPLESTSIHLIQHGVQKLLSLFPSRGINPVERDEYNRHMVNSYEPVRDFIILHYFANRRPEPFWKRMREMDLPDTLQHKIDLFRQHGRVFRYNEELFDVPSWIAVMLGQEIIPAEPDPLAAAMPDDEVLRAMRELRRAYESTAERLPLASEFIERKIAAA